jgi:nitroreductase
VLNDAVWAPNDGLREPWRFIYVTGDGAAAKLHASTRGLFLSFLIVVAKEEADQRKQDEDYAAVCCLIQNFQLLAKSKAWHVRRTIPESMYDQKQPKPFGIRPQERIVAMLELGHGVQRPASIANSHRGKHYISMIQKESSAHSYRLIRRRY